MGLPTVPIAGGGIAGLTTALALAKRGVASVVHERAPAFEEVGAGLQLSPNAARIVQRLGLDAWLDASLGRPEALVVRRARDASVIVEMPLGDVAERRWGAPTWVIHRAHLQQGLLEAVRATGLVEIRTGTTIADVVDGPAGVTATIETNGTRAAFEAPFLIAADGVWSRNGGGDAAPPRHAGRSAFRATVPMDHVPGALRRNATGLWLGPGVHFVHYALAGGALMNIVAIAVDGRPEKGWAARAPRADVLARFAEVDELARRLLDIPEDWTRWALHDRDPLPAWPGNRVMPIGDAAHPMLPFLAQGAAMAIEDADTVAEALTTMASPVAAFERVRAVRHERVSRVQREARRNGTVFHLPPPLDLPRDALLKVMGGAGLAARYDWLYGDGK
jgi:salicylate hydroxylase